MVTNITTKKFIDSIHGFDWKNLSIDNYWNNGEDNVNAVFLNYNCGFEKGGEYVKIYCDAQLNSYPNLKIQIYLLNRESNGTRDFLLKVLNDWDEYVSYIEKELFNDVKKLNKSGVYA